MHIFPSPFMQFISKILLNQLVLFLAIFHAIKSEIYISTIYRILKHCNWQYITKQVQPTWIIHSTLLWVITNLIV